jgi:phosphatidylserine decarboxylase
MRLHREGYMPLLIFGSVLAVLNLLFRRPLFLLLSGTAFGFFVQFFRNPIRHTPSDEQAVISPADGTIVAIERTHEGEFFGDERLKISIFMSVVDVHLNRVPVSGRVIFYRYHPGKYLMAFHPKSSELNERNTTVIETVQGKQVLVRQIAGILARRIVYFLAEGQPVTAGQELGFIKLGSRCDVFLPLDASVRVQMDQHVTGGETILAEW